MINYKIYEPKLSSHLSNSMPDSFTWISGSLPPSNFIVSRKSDGSTASIYSDDVWDLSAYEHQENSLVIDFNAWFDGPTTTERQHIIDELKWVVFIFIWFRKTPLGTRSIYVRFLVLKKIAIYAECKNIYLEQFFYEPRYILDYLQDSIAINITVLPSLLSDLIKVGQNILGYKVVGGNTLKQLRLIHSKYSQNFRQHPIIPSRIYHSLMQMFSDELNGFELISNKVLMVVRDCTYDPLTGLSLSSQYRKAKKLGLKWTSIDARKTFSHLLKQYDLESYFKSWETKTGNCVNSTQTLLGYLIRILYTCKHTIHLYSGMRSSEVTNLPFHCIDNFITNGKKHYRINGQTTKLHKGIPTSAVWVTSIEGIDAIKIAQKVALLVYNTIGDKPKKAIKVRHQYPLFISLGYLGFSETSSPNEHSNGYVTQFLSKKLIDYVPHLIPTIEEPDLQELESLDPHRSWRTEDEFKVGMPWPLTPHQFRRSLAVYASSSGMVSLPSLRRQLQHLTEEMTTYYARGSSFAKNLIKDNRNHFAREYQDTQPESQALAYLSHVIFSDERLFGSHGTWSERNIRSTLHLVSSHIREETLKRFKKGEIAYRETHLGGCTETIKCNKRAMRSIIGCLGCSRAVIKLSKLDRTIAIQKTFVNKLPPNTIEWKSENTDLEILLKFRQRILSQENLTSEQVD